MSSGNRSAPRPDDLAAQPHLKNPTRARKQGHFSKLILERREKLLRDPRSP
jgi:hypothetical protein